MGYYVRVLSTGERPVPPAALRAALKADGLNTVLEADDEGEWTEITLAHPSGTEIAAIDRNSTDREGLGAEELEELIEEARAGRPERAAQWLEAFLRTVKTIYAIQILSGAEEGSGWDAIGSVKTALWREVEAILQADGEGFSNADGYHVLWQFSEGVKGQWNMAVLDEHGTWSRFAMDLGDRGHREAFLDGRVPPDLKIVE